jgi:hypothetical protein
MASTEAAKTHVRQLAVLHIGFSVIWGKNTPKPSKPLSYVGESKALGGYLYSNGKGSNPAGLD